MKQRVLSLTIAVVMVALLAAMSVALPAAAQDQNATAAPMAPTQQQAAPGGNQSNMPGANQSNMPGVNQSTAPGTARGYGMYGFLPGLMGNAGCLGTGIGFYGDWGGLYQAQSIANALNMDLAGYLSARQQGRSIAAIAQAQGVDNDTLVQSVMSERQSMVDAAVKAGLMTQADADWLIAETESAFRSQLDNPTVAANTCAGMIGQFFGTNLLDTVAQALGMDRQQLLTELQSGKTLGDLLDQNNIDAQTQVIQPLLDQERTTLQSMVDAGQITSAQMNAILDQSRLRLNQLLTVPGTDLGYGTGYGPMSQPGSAYNSLPNLGGMMSGLNWNNVTSWWNSLP